MSCAQHMPTLIFNGNCVIGCPFIYYNFLHNLHSSCILWSMPLHHPLTHIATGALADWDSRWCSRMLGDFLETPLLSVPSLLSMFSFTFMTKFCAVILWLPRRESDQHSIWQRLVQNFFKQQLQHIILQCSQWLSAHFFLIYAIHVQWAKNIQWNSLVDVLKQGLHHLHFSVEKAMHSEWSSLPSLCPPHLCMWYFWLCFPHSSHQ